MRDSRYWIKVFLLSLGCCLCIDSIAVSITTMPQSAWDCIKAGRFDIGPFERPVEPVRLSDPATNHKSCGAWCKDKGVGR